MDDKLVTELIRTMQAMQQKLDIAQQGFSVRGPVADPAPQWGHHWWQGVIPRQHWEQVHNVIGPVADPGPELIFDKSRLARLKVQRLTQAMHGLDTLKESLELERNLLMEEYKLKG